jgi:uncharacterized membrane protein
MRKKPRSFVAAAYPSRAAAEAGLETLEDLGHDGAAHIVDAAIVERTEHGRVELHQRHGFSAGEGAVSGGVAGILAGLVLGFPIALPAAGIAIGAAVGAYDTGIDDGRMRRLGEDLNAGQAALCALVGEADWARVKEGMAPHVGELLVAELTPEAEAAIRAAQEQAET